MVQCDQTSVLASSIMLRNVRRLLCKPVLFSLTSEVETWNPIDRSFGGVFARVAEAGNTLVGAASDHRMKARPFCLILFAAFMKEGRLWG